ncbi:MAG: hypothetical protein HFI87_00565 [Bacilli bacterium]|nr:hypothetical protein [Bacilli bacterium]
MKNNHGQTLILFIFILPIIISLVLLLINYSFLSNEKLKLTNNVKMAIEYGLKLKLDDSVVEDGYLTNTEIKNKIEYLLQQNISYDTMDIAVNDTNIMINVTKRFDNFVKILNFFPTDIELKFYGTINNGQIMIERR